jgi:TRAP-type mannitol/chloroaromatic compound transport system substrate-binding protein
MQRRQFNAALSSSLAAVLALAHARAQALSLGDLTQTEATSGLKTALERGALTAVNLLGKTDGFLGNPKVRIPLPGYLQDAAKLMKNLGQGKRVDELVTSMNRAAEAAVPMAKDMLVGAVKSMNVNDAKNILTGGDTSVTNFFAEKTRSPLGEKFLPVVSQATQKVGLAQKYNAFASKAMSFGLVKKEDATIESYVTGKALDGLYLMIGEEEKKIRQDPVGTGSAILRKVFGVLK